MSSSITMWIRSTEKTNPGGDTDPHTGHEFLGNSGALPSVQIQGKYPRAYHGKAHECGGCHRGP